jgi:hypothetical protein
MTKKLFARILILSGVMLLLVLFAWEAFSDELSIVEVRRNIPLSDEDPVYQDYYINSGTDEGLKTNLVVSAIRKVSVRDSSGTQTYGDMLVPVGQLKVIYVGEKFSVAREFKLFSRDDQPMLEQTGIMIGDKIDMKGAFVDSHKLPGRKPAKPAVSKIDVKVEAPIATATPAPAAPATVVKAPPAKAPAAAEVKAETSAEDSKETPADEVAKTASAEEATN